MHLRKYQQNILDQSRELLKKHRAIIITLATGGGKSIIISEIMKGLKNNNKRGYITTHRQEIHNQMVQHCIKNDIYPGQIVSGQRMTSNNIQVAMIQTLYRKMNYLKSVWADLICADECHHYASNTFCQVINYKEETKIIGFTATPQRTDGTGLNTAGFTAMVEGAQTIDLVNAGYLTPMSIFSSETTEIFRKQKFKVKNNEYDKDEQFIFSSQKQIIDDTINVYKKYFNGAPCIIFCCSVDDSEYVANIMRSNGWKCESVSDKLDYETRKKYIDGLSNGSMNCITCYDIIGEGVDIAILQGIIIRRLTCSLINWLQWIGRALRKSPGKKNAIVIDQAGNIFKHGHGLLRREWSLDGTIKESKEDEIQIKQCPECAAWIMKNVKICPYCNCDLTSIKPERPDKIKIINAPLIEIKPPEIQVGNFAIDECELMEYAESDIDLEIVKRLQMLKENNTDIHDRLSMIAKYFNKSNKWLSETWDRIKDK